MIWHIAVLKSGAPHLYRGRGLWNEGTSTVSLRGAGLQMRRGLPALIRDREVDLHLRRGPFFPYRCAGDRPVAKKEIISLKALRKEV